MARAIEAPPAAVGARLALRAQGDLAARSRVRMAALREALLDGACAAAIVPVRMLVGRLPLGRCAEATMGLHRGGPREA
ncbi:hypothetical protein H6A15_06110 [Enorma phocaeensis]|nr:hypothetical protein [Enorma phocaeensis]